MEVIRSKIREVTVDPTDLEFFYFTVNQQQFRIRWSDCSPRLAEAPPTQRAEIDISPSGYGLHWPLMDEDLAVEPLLHEAERVDDLR
jgi:hypothetical protein